MRRIWIPRAGKAAVLEVREESDRAPAAGEVCIDVVAAGVNFADVLARTGMYPDAPPFPCVVGYEVSGRVRSVGDGVAEARPELVPGRAVMALTRFGGYSDLVCAHHAQVFALPEEIPVEDAAALPVNYLTAWLALRRLAVVHPGDLVLIHNAGGGVGIAATQLAKAAGARTVGTSSPWKHAALTAAGLDHAVDYRSQNVTEEVRRIEARGADVILNPMGGSTVRRDLDLLAPLGHLIVFGLSEPVAGGRRSWWRLLRSLIAMPRPGVLGLISRNQSIAGLNIGHLWSDFDRFRAAGEYLLEDWKRGVIAPVIHARVPFDEAARAHEILQERTNLGKVLLVP